MCHYKTWRDLVWKISPADWMCALYSTRAWLSVFMGVCFCANLCVLLLPSRMRGCGTNPCNLSDWRTPSGWELVTMPDGNEISDPPILFWFYFCPTSLKSLTDFHTDWLRHQLTLKMNSWWRTVSFEKWSSIECQRPSPSQHHLATQLHESHRSVTGAVDFKC